jgi:hypothetical protein
MAEVEFQHFPTPRLPRTPSWAMHPDLAFLPIPVAVATAGVHGASSTAILESSLPLSSFVALAACAAAGAISVKTIVGVASIEPSQYASHAQLN